MKRRPKPIHRSGDKNIGCPLYTRCLDHAAKNHWQHWDCSECPHRMDHEPIRVDFASYGFDPQGEVLPGVKGQMRGRL